MSEQLRVLAVDDDEAVRRSLRMRLVLDSTIEIVGEAGDTRTAATLALAIRPDVVLLDLNLPDANGLELCMALTASQIPVVMFSLDDSEQTQRGCLAAGASSFVSKRAPARVLLSSLHAACAIPESDCRDWMRTAGVSGEPNPGWRTGSRNHLT